jgi:hypothetical protein
VHLHASVAARLNHPGLKSMNKSVTALRLENFASAVAGRKQRLKEALKVYGKALELDHREDAGLLGRAASPFGDAEPADAAVAASSPSRPRRRSSSPPSSATCRPRRTMIGPAA